MQLDYFDRTHDVGFMFALREFVTLRGGILIDSMDLVRSILDYPIIIYNRLVGSMVPAELPLSMPGPEPEPAHTSSRLRVEELNAHLFEYFASGLRKG